MRLFPWLLLLGVVLASTDVRAAEDEDFGVAPSASLRVTALSSPTPREIPGAKVLLTEELRLRLRGDAARRLLVFDVLGGEAHDSLPGAIWLPGAGRGVSMADGVQPQLARLLQAATQGDLDRPIQSRVGLGGNGVLHVKRTIFPVHRLDEFGVVEGP